MNSFNNQKKIKKYNCINETNKRTLSNKFQSNKHYNEIL